MTLKELRDRLRYFEDHDGDWDDEGAHVTEDELRKDVLQAIAEGTAEYPEAMARLVLTTGGYDFARWYA